MLQLRVVTFNQQCYLTPDTSEHTQAGTQFTYPTPEVWKAKLTWVTVTYQHGLAAHPYKY